MSHSPPGSPATPDVGPVSSAVDAAPPTPEPVLITEQEVVFSTAAAVSVPPATTRHCRLGATLVASIQRIRMFLTTTAQPRRHYPARECIYMETARMSRQMDRL
jgi:hypothetical protein